MINKYVEAVGLASTRDMAIVMARRGFRVFPLLPNTRIPFQWNMDDPNERNCSPNDRSLAGGIHKATRDETVINSWFDHDLDPAFAEYEGRAINYGIAAAGLVILDVDVKGGKPGVEDLLSLGRLPETFTVGTTTGGMHLYFGGAEVGQKPLTKAIDIRSRGGYVVGPGSVIDGKRYKIVDDVPIATVPDKLLDRLKRAADPAEKTATPVTELDKPKAIEIAVAIAKREPPAPIHGRNNEAFALACRLKDFGLSAEKTFDVLDEHWNARNAAPEPLDEAELRRCCENAYAYGRYAPGVQNAAVEFEDLPAALAAIEDEGRIRATSWEWREPISIPPREWVYGRHYIKGFVSSTVAPGGVGKSSLVLVEAVAMASGRDLLGHPVREPKRVWYINLEDPADELDRRIAAICKHFRITEADLGGRLFVDNGRDAPVCIAREDRNGLKIIEPCVDGLLDEIKAQQIEVLAIDPFVRAHAVSENDNMKIAAVVGAFAGIADKGKCSVELVHHIRKNGGAEVTSEDARGGAAFIDLARSSRVLNRMAEDDAKRMGVKTEDRLSCFRVDRGKVNLVRATDRSDWYRLVNVPLNNGAPHLAGDEVGVATRFIPPTLDELLPDDALQLAWKAIEPRKRRADRRADDWAGHAVMAAWGWPQGDDTLEHTVSKALARWINEGWFREIDDKDAHRNIKKFLVVGECPPGLCCSAAVIFDPSAATAAE